MNLSQTILAALTMISIAVAGATSEARDRVDNRQTRQNVRVREGVRSGDITAGEAARLQASKRVVRRKERRAEADGTVTAEEAAKLEKLQDARSHQIHRVKNNDKTPADGQ